MPTALACEVRFKVTLLPLGSDGMRQVNVRFTSFHVPLEEEALSSCNPEGIWLIKPTVEAVLGPLLLTEMELATFAPTSTGPLAEAVLMLKSAWVNGETGETGSDV